jgi:hypothetical protein
MSLYAVTLLVLLGLPPSNLDDETVSERSVRLAWLATAISQEARTTAEAEALVTLDYLESNVAGYVQNGHCMDPPWNALQYNCDQGRARSGYQLHRCTCGDLWALDEGTYPALVAATRCALRLWRAGVHQCGSVAGAFGIYAGAKTGCDWSGGSDREKVYRRIQGRFSRARRQVRQAG